MADVAMPQAPLAAPADENAAPSNVACNPLLAGACDDDDNELTEAQKKIIEERLKALQARFKEFEEKTLKQKVDELVLANEGLTEAEAEMTLKVCNGNEFEASDRLSNEDEDHEQFRRAIRRMVLDEQRSRTSGSARAPSWRSAWPRSASAWRAAATSTPTLRTRTCPTGRSPTGKRNPRTTSRCRRCASAYTSCATRRRTRWAETQAGRRARPARRRASRRRGGEEKS